MDAATAIQMLEDVSTGRIRATPEQCPQVGIEWITYRLDSGWQIVVFVRQNRWKYAEAFISPDGARFEVPDDLGEDVLYWSPTVEQSWRWWRLPEGMTAKNGPYRCETCERHVEPVDFHVREDRGLCFKCAGEKRRNDPRLVRDAKFWAHMIRGKPSHLLDGYSASTLWLTSRQVAVHALHDGAVDLGHGRVASSLRHLGRAALWSAKAAVGKRMMDNCRRAEAD